MFSQTYRIICIIVSVAVFLIAVGIFVFGFSKIGTDPDFLKEFALYGFILLNLGLLLMWQGLGRPGGLVFFAVSVPLVMLASLGAKSLIYNFQIIIMAGITIASYVFYKRTSRVLNENVKEEDNLQEETNILNDNMKKNIGLILSLSNKLDRYSKLKDLGEAFNAKLSLDDIYQLTVDRACEIIGKTNEAKLFLVSENAQELLLCSWYPKEKDQDATSEKADTFDRWVFNKAQPLQISDITKDFRFDYQQNKNVPEIRSLIIVPLVIQRRGRGILRLSSEKEGAYTEDDLRLLDFISNLAASAINNARLYIRTQELAIRDSLTGLYVHRYFKERLAEEISRCEKNKTTLSILMFDVDHFKDYNDKYGHAAGDKALKGIADIMQAQDAAKASILARYGGEEFVALLPGIEKDRAISATECIREKIESTPFVLRRRKTNITVSAGVASFPDDASSGEGLLEKVDFLLYKAKKEGRNKICSN